MAFFNLGRNVHYSPHTFQHPTNFQNFKTINFNSKIYFFLFLSHDLRDKRKLSNSNDGEKNVDFDHKNN